MAESLRTSMMSYGMGGGTGTITLFGPDLSQWPSYFVDAMLIYMEEYGLVNEALQALDKAADDQARH